MMTGTISKNTRLSLAMALTFLVMLLLPASLFAGGDSENKFATQAEKILKQEFDLLDGETVGVELKVGGNIHIIGWDRNKVEIEAQKSGRDSEFCIVSFKERSGGVFVLAERAGDRRNVKCSVDIFIQAPVRSNMELHTMGGSIVIDHIEGEIDGETMGGEMELSNLSGRVGLTTMGGSITVKNSDLDGFVKTMGGNINVEDVQGSLDASSMGGKVIYSGESRKISDGDILKISTMGGPIKVDEAPSGVEASTMGGLIHVKSAKKFANVKTMGGSISIDKIDGWVKATTMGGDVKVVMTGDPSQGKRDVEISSMGGDIRLTVPAGLSMDVDITLAYTKDALRQYRIISNFDLELEETDKFDYSKGSARKYIYGTGLIRGGKYKIIVSTVNGNVYLKEGK